jgi:hypothetical protein
MDIFFWFWDGTGFANGVFMNGGPMGCCCPHSPERKHIMKTPFALLATVAALLITTGAAHADVLPSNASISFEDSYGPAGTDWQAPGKLLHLDQFDPLLGTLNAVSFQWRGTLNTSFWASNPTTNLNTLRYSASGSMAFGLPLPASAQLVFGPQAGEIELAGGQEVTLPVLLELMGGGVFTGNLADFIGTDTVDLRVVAQGDSFMTDESGNVDFDVTTTASAWVQVTYDYTANGNQVPEPGALSLLGLALAAAGIASRRRA